MTDPIKVLIADDESLTRKILRKVLTDLGYQVIECENGRQAWEVMKSKDSPRLCLVDWEMPEIIGPDLCNLCRTLPDGYNFYLIMLTSKSNKREIAHGLAAGANDYLIKPPSKEELKQRLEIGCRYLELRAQLGKSTG